ncbi:hypothetical protein EON79_20170, partial [bacterium]
AIFPALTQFMAQGRKDLFREQLTSTLRTVLFLAIPISVLMAIMAPEIVATMYLHGKFTQEAADRTSDCLRLFSFGIWAWCLHPVLMRGYYALQDTKSPVILGTVTTGVFIVLLLMLRQTPLSYQAAPLSSSIAATGLVVIMLLALHRKSGGLALRRMAVTGAKSLGASLAAGIVAAIILLPAVHSAIAGRKVVTAIVTLGLGIVAMSVYTLAARMLKMPETEYVDRALARLRRRASSAPAA